MTTPSFIPGLELSRHFYLEAVRPLLDEAVPGMPHSAARLGSGSEVLGFDTPRSADHEWGPRLQVFLPPQDVTRHGTRITELLSERLPKTFSGYPTHFAATDESGIGVMRTTDGPVHHRVEVTDLSAWFTTQLGFDPGEDITLTDWLATPPSALPRSLPVPSSTTDSATSYRPEPPSTGTPMISGSTCSPASGNASPRKKPLSDAAAK